MIATGTLPVTAEGLFFLEPTNMPINDGKPEWSGIDDWIRQRCSWCSVLIVGQEQIMAYSGKTETSTVLGYPIRACLEHRFDSEARRKIWIPTL